MACAGISCAGISPAPKSLVLSDSESMSGRTPAAPGLQRVWVAVDDAAGDADAVVAFDEEAAAAGAGARVVATGDKDAVGVVVAAVACSSGSGEVLGDEGSESDEARQSWTMFLGVSVIVACGRQ